MEGSIPDKVQLGKAIQAVRKNRGMTSEGLADAAGIDRAHMNRAENHGRNFTWETLGCIAGALRVPISDLVSKAEQIADSEPQTEAATDARQP